MVVIEFPIRSILFITLTACTYQFTYAQDNVQRYFESDESTIFDNNDVASSNRDGSNPIVTVKKIDISKLIEMPEYGINKDELEIIIRNDQKENSFKYTVDRLEHLAEKISLHYKKQGLILAKAYFPPQDLKNNSLYLDVVLGEIESITTKRNDYYSSERLIRPFKDILNKPAYIPTLESSLIELNNYPGISLNTHFQEGTDLGKTQIDIRVDDEKISDFNFSFDNYGSEYTGSMRAMLKANFYNLADQADQLNLNLLATIDPTNSVYVGASYKFKVAPFFNSRFLNSTFRHGWNTTLGFQQTDYVAGGDIEAIDYEGKASTLYLKLDKDFILRNSHKLNSGFILSKKEAKTIQGGNENSSDNLAIFTWSTQFKWNDHIGSPSANLIHFEFHQGLPGFAGSDENNDPNLNLSRYGYVNGVSNVPAPLDYKRYNLILTRNQGVGPYRFVSKLNVQYSDDMLLASEQSNLGGANSVRGYKNSDFSSDRSNILTFELIGRSNARKYAMPISDLQLAGFVDYGLGERLHPFGSEEDQVEMLSIGGYALFLSEGKFSSKMEIAMPLNEVGDSKKNGLEILFNFERGF